MGPCTLPDPEVPSKKVTSKELAPGPTELSKIKPDWGVELNIPLFSINETNSSSPPGVLTVSTVVVKSKAPPGAVRPEMSTPGVTPMSRTASSPVPSATV